MQYLQVELLDSHSGDLQTATALFSVRFPGHYDFENLAPVVTKADMMASIALPELSLEQIAYRITRH